MKKVICLLAFCTLAYAQYGEKRRYGRKDPIRPILPDPFPVDPLPVQPIDPLPLPVNPFPKPLVPEKPGQCPVIDIFTPCVVTPENNPCSRDFQCPGRRKCCRYGCGTRCLLPVGTGPIINKKGCKYNGRFYKQGASFPSKDECNTCTCRSYGRVSCTERACFVENLPQCLQPKKVGHCRAAFPRWYYNKPERRCQFFIYGGCGGNENNFESKAECLRTCGSKYVPSVGPIDLRIPDTLIA